MGGCNLHRGMKAIGKCHGPMQLNLNMACYFVNVTIKLHKVFKKVKQALSYYFNFVN